MAIVIKTVFECDNDHCLNSKTVNGQVTQSHLNLPDGWKTDGEHIYCSTCVTINEYWKQRKAAENAQS